ncbi:MAG: hypothetical protein R2686_07235 [Candidatus Nanopelagicales bacterium]
MPTARFAEQWFPQVREGPGQSFVQEIGAQMRQAPRRPSALRKTVDAIIA